METQILKLDNKSGGFIALMAVLIISITLLGVSFTRSNNGFFSRFSALDSENKRIGLGLAESCVNVALLKLAEDYDYTPGAGGEVVEVNPGATPPTECIIKSISCVDSPCENPSTHQKKLLITTQAEYNKTWSNTKVEATIQNPDSAIINPGTLTVVTHVINDDFGGPGNQAADFVVTVSPGVNPNPSTFNGSETGTAVQMFSAGNYDVTSTNIAGYTQTRNDCSGHIDLGENKSTPCTIIENDIPTTATLTVVAEVLNDSGTGTKIPSDFSLSIDGTSQASGVPKTGLSASGAGVTHTASAAAMSGYTASTWGADCSSGGSVVLHPGDNKTCIIKYDDNPPPAPSCADTVLMLDRTGSMFGHGCTAPVGWEDAIADEQAAANALVAQYNSVNPHPQIGIGRFANGTSTLASSAEIVATLSSTYTNALNAIATRLTDNTGLTNLRDAISVADAELNSSRHILGKKKVLVLVSDGGANMPGGAPFCYDTNSSAKNSATTAANAAKLATGAGKASDNIATQIYTIHFGDDGTDGSDSNITGDDQDFLATLADNSANDHVGTITSDTGLLFTTSNTQNGGSGDNWQTPQNAESAGGGSATDTGGHKHRYYNFEDVSGNSLSSKIPSGATIQYVEVKATASVTDAPTNGSTTLLPSAVGNFSSWTQNGGSSKQNAVSDNNNGTYVSQGIDAQTFVVANAGVPPGATINSVTLNVTAQETNGNASIQLMAENGSGSSASQIRDTIKPLTGSWATYSWVVPTKPDGSAWTLSEVNAWTTRFGIFKASPGGTARVSQVSVVVTYIPATDSGLKIPTSTHSPNNWDTNTVGNAQTSNNIYISDNDNDQQGYSFGAAGLSIPVSATVTGIEVVAEAKSSDGNGCQIEAELSSNGSTFTNTSNTDSLSGSDTTTNLGGPGVMWGRSWSSSDFNSANFTVRVAGVDPGSSCTNNSTTSIDLLQIKVYYSLPAIPTASLLPSAVGNFSSWTQNGGSSKQNAVSDSNNTTYVSEGISAQTFVVGNAGVPPGATINSVTLNVTAQETNGNASIQLMAENGSGSSASQIMGNAQSLTSTWATYTSVVSTKPDGSAWTAAEVNAWTTRFGIFKASPGGTARVSQVWVVVAYTAPATPSTSCKLGVDLSWNGSAGTPSWTAQKTQTLSSTLTTLPSFGTSSDLWTGHTWVPADFSNNNFRVRVQDIDPDANCSGSATTNLDLLQTRVYYSTVGVDAVAENGDGDNFYISPTSDKMVDIFKDIGTKVCLSQVVPPPSPPTTGRIIIITNVINDGGGTASANDFTSIISATNPTPSGNQNGVAAPGITVTVKAESYEIDQASKPGYIKTLGVGCKGTLTGGETKTCSITDEYFQTTSAIPATPPPLTNIIIGPWTETP